MIRFSAFLLLFVALSTSAAAQSNTVEVEQAGDSNIADVEQAGSGNAAGVEQGGTSNSATVLQKSDANTADVKQTGESNTTTVRQTDEEAGPYSGDNNSATVEQTGQSNVVYLDQKSGGYSTATVLQGTEGGAATGNSVSIEHWGWEQGQHVVNVHQGVAGTATGSWVIVDQDPGGTFEMQSDVFQGVHGGKSTDDGARIVQWFGSSQAEVRQGAGGSAESVGNRAEVYQRLSIFSAFASIFQGVDGGSATESWAEIEQGELLRGDALAVIKQGVGEGSVSSGNRAIVSQDAANGASAYVEQGIRGGVATNNEATISQGAGRLWIHQGDQGSAEGNSATIGQTSGGAVGRVEQGVGGNVGSTSTGNEAALIQNAATNGSIFQGTDHNGWDGGAADDNVASISQDVDGASAVIWQGRGEGSATSSIASVVQSAAAEAEVGQALHGSGSDVQATVEQSGDGAVARVRQGGNEDRLFGSWLAGDAYGTEATVTQTASATAHVDQGFGYATSASGSVATVDQSGAGAFAEVSQGGSGGPYGDPASSVDDVVTIEQSAAAEAHVSQSRGWAAYTTRNTVSVEQSSDGASTRVRQGFGGYYAGSSQGSAVSVNQSAAASAEVNQGQDTGGRAYEALATITQGADGAVAEVRQGASDGFGQGGVADGVTATVSQTGAAEAHVHQAIGSRDSYFDDVSAVGSDATVTQTASGAYTRIEQGVAGALNFGRSAEDVVTVVQNAAATATVSQGYQGFSLENAATLTQTGAAEAYVIQGGGLGSQGNGSASGSTVLVVQSADGALAQVYQGVGDRDAGYGYGNAQNTSAEITQSATGEARIHQGYAGYSTGDEATISQQGGQATIYQGSNGGYSAGNDAAVHQEGMSVAEIFQGVEAGAGAGAASISQLGDGHEAVIKQSGAGNTATISQGM